jgi:hypothetical protein
VRVVGRLASGNSDSVSLGVALLSDSDGLCDVAGGRSVTAKVDSDGLGDWCRAVGRDGNIGSGDRWCLDGSLRDGHIGCWARLATAAVDGGGQSLGDVAWGQVGGVDGGVATLTDGSRAWDPSVGSRGDGGCDIMRRLRLGGCWGGRGRRCLVVASALARRYRDGAGGRRGDDLGTRSLSDRADRGCGVCGVLSGGW